MFSRALKIEDFRGVVDAECFNLHSFKIRVIYSYIYSSFLHKEVHLSSSIYIHPFIHVNVITVHSYTHTVYLKDSSFVQARAPYSIFIEFILRSFKAKPSQFIHILSSYLSFIRQFIHTLSTQFILTITSFMKN